MRFKGTLTEWKDDRGFGFIEPAEGGSRVFCHIKAFDVRVRRPVAGDRVTYEVGKDALGRLTANKVRPVGLEEAQYQSNVRLHRDTKARQPLSARNMGILICLIAATGYAGFSYFKSRQSAAFQCDGRVYCSDMHSRAEAEFFLKNCPGTKMDGDNDGVPCEHDSRF